MLEHVVSQFLQKRLMETTIVEQLWVDSIFPEPFILEGRLLTFPACVFTPLQAPPLRHGAVAEATSGQSGAFSSQVIYLSVQMPEDFNFLNVQ